MRIKLTIRHKHILEPVDIAAEFVLMPVRFQLIAHDFGALCIAHVGDTECGCWLYSHSRVGCFCVRVIGINNAHGIRRIMDNRLMQ